MIFKASDVPSTPTGSKQLDAGNKAERDMAYRLHRAFDADPDVLVLNNLRLVDPSRSEFDGRPRAVQMDHLLIHRRGAIIIESKSVSETLVVKRLPGGGEEWTRLYQNKPQGMASPIEQASMQAICLRDYLSDRKEGLLGKMPFGLRTVSKLITGSDQRGFGAMPIQIIVAISVNGRLETRGGWTEPTEPFRVYVRKADGVVGAVREEVRRHGSAEWVKQDASRYGLWSMSAEEAVRVAGVLARGHAAR